MEKDKKKIVMKASKMTGERLKNGPVYVTLALADVQSRDEKTYTTRPSEASVEEARKWCETNQL